MFLQLAGTRIETLNDQVQRAAPRENLHKKFNFEPEINEESWNESANFDVKFDIV